MMSWNTCTWTNDKFQNFKIHGVYEYPIFGILDVYDFQIFGLLDVYLMMKLDAR